MSLPFTRGSATSRAAAEDAEARAPSVARSIWMRAVERGSEGITRDEMIVEFSGRAAQTTVTARITGLVGCGLLADSTTRRPTRTGNDAEVLTAVPGADFDTLYREAPSGRNRAERAFLAAAQAWVQAHGTEHERDALEALLDAGWATYGEGPRPTPWNPTEW